MRTTQTTVTRAATTAAAVLLALNLALLAWYLFVTYPIQFHSDSAAKVLLAREIVDTGSYFPADWNYANGDVFVLFGHTFVIPLLALLPAGYTAHALAGVVSAGLILTGLWLLTGLFPLSTARRLLVVAIGASGVSNFAAEFLFGQVAYGVTVCFACFVLLCSWRTVEAEPARRRPWAAALAAVFLVLTWANPMRTFVTYALPLVSAILILRSAYPHLMPVRQRPAVGLILLAVLAAMALGTVLHGLVVDGRAVVGGLGAPKFVTYEATLDALATTPKGVLALFGALPTPGRPVVSPPGVFEAVRLATALLLFALMPLAAVRTLSRGDAGLVFVCLFTLVAFLAVLFVFVATTVPDMSDPISVSRYLLPSLFLAMVLVVAQPLDDATPLWFAGGVAVVSAVLVLGAWPAYVRSPSEDRGAWGVDTPPRHRLEPALDLLRANGLQYGYATFWNAGAATVLADETVRIRSIKVEQGIPLPDLWLASNAWYRPAAWEGPTFLMLSAAETATVDWETLTAMGVTPTRRLEVGDFTVHVFADNPAARLPGWGFDYRRPATFPASAQARFTTGRFEPATGTAPAALVAAPTDTGALHFGPYVRVEPGSYQATFDLDAEPHPEGAVSLDVTAHPDGRAFARATLDAARGRHALPFDLSSPCILEFRVWALGHSRVVYRGVTIRRVAEAEPRQP